MEGLLQSSKTKSIALQQKVCGCSDKTTKIFFQYKFQNIRWKIKGRLYWKGKIIDRYSDEYQRLLVEHNITQSMSRKGNCTDSGIMENFFGRLKVEMYYGAKFEFPRGFIEKLEEYIHYYNNERISIKLKGMSSVQYRAHSQAI